MPRPMSNGRCVLIAFVGVHPLHSRPVLTPSTGEVSMASLIFGYIASMATILVVLMVLLNSYLQPSLPTAVQ